MLRDLRFSRSRLQAAATRERRMTLSIADHISWQNVPGELALFDTRDGRYHALNGTAAEIWRGIAAGQEPAEIAADLRTRHDAPDEEIEQAVEDFIAAARDKGLLA
jgi:PqqD family protein of HPr-rel-A system